MKLYKWLLWDCCDYNIVAVLNKTEAAEVLTYFGEAAKTRSIDGQYFYFLNTWNRIISPSPSPSLVISQHYDEPPIGKEIRKPFLNLRRYRLKKFCVRSDRSTQWIASLQALWTRLFRRES